MANYVKPEQLIACFKNEAVRLEGIAARFKKAHSIHFTSVQSMLQTLNKHIERMESQGDEMRDLTHYKAS
jgi:hypothetical protein